LSDLIKGSSSNPHISLIITADYEIFGDGSGDVRNCMVRPTRDLLEICERHGARLTIFFEVGEYWAFKEAEKQGFLDLGYSPSKLMEDQIRKAIQSGHDVQLHLHPQWLDYDIVNNEWKLNLNYWRLPLLPHGLGNKNDRLSIRGALHQGKKTLEEILTPVNPSYRCIAFRAGGWCIQPAERVIRAMRDVGILADSSVFKGGHITDDPFFVDYRTAYSSFRYWWVDSKEINWSTEPSHAAILEIPIFTIPYRGIGELMFRKIIRDFGRNSLKKTKPQGCEGKPLTSKKRQETKFVKNVITLFSIHPRQFDYCNLTSHEMLEFLKRAYNKLLPREKIPLIMTGHPKSFTNHKELDCFLKTVKAFPYVTFSTMQIDIENIYRYYNMHMEQAN
jgi:hypothetical protein